MHVLTAFITKFNTGDGESKITTGKYLKSRLFHAGGWTVGAYGFTQATRLLSSLIMTRLLLPEVFGIMAIAMVVNAGLMMFSDLGLLQSIVRSKRGEDAKFLNTLWTLQILRGFAIWVTALTVGTGLAGAQSLGWIDGDTAYAHPILPFVIGAIGFSAVLQGFESTKIAVARRELLLARVSQLEIGCNIVAVVTTVSWALIDRSIWALVGGWLVAAALKSALTHTIFPGDGNRFQWDHSALHEAVNFGKWVFLSSILTFLTASADRLILSGFLSAQQLGIYSIAYLIANAVQQGSAKLSSYVAYPALSEIARTRPEHFCDAYYKIRLPFDLMCLLLGGFMTAAGNGIVTMLYDSRYAGAGPLLAILSLTLIAARFIVADQAFLALGKPKLLAIANAFRMITLYSFIPLGYFAAGLEGAVWGIVTANLMTAVVTLYFAAKNGIFSLRIEFVRLLALPAGYIAGFGIQWIVAG